jgi:hypothetical protein
MGRVAAVFDWMRFPQAHARETAAPETKAAWFYST